MDEADGMECKAYGTVGVTRLPGRTQISWQHEQTLRLEFSNAVQTRFLYYFQSQNAASMPIQLSASRGAATWRGYSTAPWQKQVHSRRCFAGKKLAAVDGSAGGAGSSHHQ